MEPVKTKAVPIRITPYADSDIIAGLFTENAGKVAVMAKAAKKSRRRFSGGLDILGLYDVVYSRPNRGGGLPVLSEAERTDAFEGIRSDVAKFAVASFWAEILFKWLPENEAAGSLFGLFTGSLSALSEAGKNGRDAIHAAFLARFLDAAGLAPRLDSCARCGAVLPEKATRTSFDPAAGGIVCRACGGAGREVRAAPLRLLAALSQGMAPEDGVPPENDLAQALEIVEAFAVHHLGGRFNSLAFLRGLR